MTIDIFLFIIFYNLSTEPIEIGQFENNIKKISKHCQAMLEIRVVISSIFFKKSYLDSKMNLKIFFMTLVIVLVVKVVLYIVWITVGANRGLIRGS